MKGKKITKVGSALLASLLTFSSLGVDVYANEIRVRSTSQTQMESEAEIVYINNITDSSVRRHLFNANWKFNLGDARGAEAKIFDDAKWDLVSVPHDYSIIQAYDKTLEAESGYLPGGVGWYRKYFTLGEEMKGKKIRIDFDGVYNNATVYVNGVEVGMHPYGYTPFSFDITEHLKFGEENVISVKVDHKTPSSRWYSGSGIYRDVFLTVTNPVHVDLYGQKVTTPNLKTEKDGEVTVNVKTTIANDSEAEANVSVKHTVYEKNNADKVIGTFTTEAKTIAQGAKDTIDATFKTTEAPKLWDTTTPDLYVVKSEVMIDGKAVDTIEDDFGFRYFEMDTERGAFLNGENIKLKGVCMHHDQGALGSAAYHDAIRRQVKILKDMGSNSIRVTHNPAGQALIDICNEEGILVIDEFFDGWMNPKNGNRNDFSVWFNKNVEASNTIMGATSEMTWAEFEIKNTINRAYNDPSVIMWSLGNEIQEGTGIYDGYKQKAPDLIQWAQSVDTTRMLTVGSNAVKNGDGNQVDIANQLTAVGGTSGTNYSDGNSYDALHRNHSDWKLYGSETASSVNSRGVYTTKQSGGNSPASLDQNKQLTSYDKSKVPWGALASEAWYDVIKRDFVAGEYVWTGFDYIGEPTPANGTGSGNVGSWPSPKNSYFGIIDTAGFPKDSYYFYQAQWNENVNTLHILPVWNRDSVMVDNSGKVEVVVYSDADKVELYLNEQKVGEQEFDTHTTTEGYTYKTKKGENNSADDLFATFNVTFEEGTLSAKAYKKLENGDFEEITENLQGRHTVKTTKEASKLSATVYGGVKEIEANNEDLFYVEVDVTDVDGNVVPNATNPVTFKVEGEGVLVGVDNGSAPDHQSYKDDNRKAHAGKVLAIVKATSKDGNITVTASAAGLESSSVTVKSNPVSQGETSGTVALSYKASRNLYVKVGSEPKLPEQVEVTYSNGTVEMRNVTWEDFSSEDITTANTFIVIGKTEDNVRVTMNVNMITNVVAIKNFSTAVALGAQSVALPARLPGILEDGTVMDAQFDVTWEQVDPEQMKEEGIFTVNGTANVFGEEKAVKATVRVQKEQITLGNNIASQAAKVTQDIPEDKQSDTLSAIYDGDRAYRTVTGGTNPSCWSNYDASQAGDPNAVITFLYDTQALIGKINITFNRDNWSARYPAANTVKLYADESETPIVVKETISEETAGPATNTGWKTYSYDFAPTMATKIRVEITNDPNASALQPTIRPCTSVTEVEIIKAEGSFVTNSTAELASLTLNGEDLTAAQLANDTFTTAAKEANITNAVGKDNASVTVLPPFENLVKILIESEDHKNTKVFTIKLDTYTQVAPDDKTYDLPVEASWITVPNEASGETKDKMLDYNASTKWHSDWSNEGCDFVSNLANRNIKVTFPEAVNVNGVRYLPRIDEPNGSIKDFTVEYKLDVEGAEWQEAASGTWTTRHEWKIIQFKTIENVKELRIVGVNTGSDNSQKINKLLSAAEFHVMGYQELVDLSAFETSLEGVVEGEITVPYMPEEGVKPAVTVVDGDNTLVLGKDYEVAYEGNTEFGEATVTITGIGKYTGTKTITFTIKQAPVTISTINYVTSSAKTIYTEGEKFDPTGLKLNVVYSDLSETEVAYTDETASQFTFSPSLDTALALDMTEVTVTYEGKTTTIAITVKEKTPDPVVVDKEALAALVEKAKEYQAEFYTAESFMTLQGAIGDAKAVLADPMVTQNLVDHAKDLLQQAIDGLVLITVDYDKLQSLVTKAEAMDTSIYTAETVAVFEAALADAKDAIESKASQTVVDQAFSSLTNAIAGLKRIEGSEGGTTDTKPLEALLDKAIAIKAEGYTVESYNALQEAIKAAQVALENDELTQEQIDAIQAALQAAIDGLVKADINNPGQPSTGDSTNVIFFVGLALVAVVGIIFVLKGKKKQ